MIVIDASAVLEILAASPIGLELESVLDGSDLHAPHLIDIEVLSAVRKWEMRGDIGRSDGARILGIFRTFRITRHPHTHLLDPIWALRHNLTAYDGAYLALAKSLDAKLVTMDAGLRRAAAN